MDFKLVLSTILFPGIVIHELSHVIACVILGVKINKIKWIGKDGGFVEHEDSNSWKIIIIALIPFFFNILISLLFARFYLLTTDLFIKIISVWIAISAIFYSLPSREDAINVLGAFKKRYSKLNILDLLLNLIFSPISLVVLILTFIFRIIDRSIFIRVLMIFAWLFLFI